SMKCMSRIVSMWSRQWNRIGVEMLYGRLPTTRNGAPAASARKSTFSTSAWMIESDWPSAGSDSRRGNRSRSSSMTVSFPSSRNSGALSAPSPGPISTMRSPGCGPIARTMRPMIPASCRKCWPKRFLCAWRSPRWACIGMRSGGPRGEFDREPRRRDQAARFGAAAARDVERGAVIDRGADPGQAERDVHRVAETGVFQYRQALVVVHREDCIELRGMGGHERGIGRQRTDRVDARGLQFRDGRNDRVDFLATEMAALARVRIEAEYRDARAFDAEARVQVAFDDTHVADDARLRDRGGNPRERQMRRRERDAQAFGNQHHDDVAVRARSEELRMTGERHARVIDDRLV